MSASHLGHEQTSGRAAVTIVLLLATRVERASGLATGVWSTPLSWVLPLGPSWACSRVAFGGADGAFEEFIDELLEHGQQQPVDSGDLHDSLEVPADFGPGADFAQVDRAEVISDRCT